MVMKGLIAIRAFYYAPEGAEKEGETPKPRRLLSFGLPKPGRGRHRGLFRTSFAPPRCSPRRSSRRCRPTLAPSSTPPGLSPRPRWRRRPSRRRLEYVPLSSEEPPFPENVSPLIYSGETSFVPLKFFRIQKQAINTGGFCYFF
jgi:hypothetical protein